ncbi:hypothetical protein WG66_001064 [Moniliophthora roreri]|nr:hypothetical protein WG66_001064 [Moniliophthora roreri]
MSLVLRTAVAASTLSFLERESQASSVPYLRNLAIWAYDTHEAVVEHNEHGSLHYLLAVYLCEKVFCVLKQYEPIALEIRSGSIEGEILSARLRIEQMSFRDAVEDIYLFTQKRYDKNILVRMGRKVLGIDLRKAKKLAARLGHGHDQLQL